MTHKLHYICGLHALTALLSQNPSKAQQLFVQKGRRDARVQAILKLAKQHNIDVCEVERALLDQWTGQASHQGVALSITALSYQTEYELFALLDALTSPPFLLVLDGVQDPRNLGACLRTASAAGVNAVIIPADKSAPLTEVVLKVASGAAETTPLIRVTNLSRVLNTLKERGIWIYGASGAAKQSVFSGDFSGAMAWVLGAEGKGLRKLTEECCDALFHIPMSGSISSLNVSVAAGVCLFEAVRQRSP